MKCLKLIKGSCASHSNNFNHISKKHASTTIMIKVTIMLMIAGSALSVQGITLDQEINIITRNCFKDLTGSQFNSIKDFELKLNQSNDDNNFRLFKESEVKESWLSTKNTINGVVFTDQGSTQWIEKIEDTAETKSTYSATKNEFFLKINPNQSYDVSEDTMEPNRRIFQIPLHELEDGLEWTITGANYYKYRDQLTSTFTVGNIVSISAEGTGDKQNTEVYSRLVFYGTF